MYYIEGYKLADKKTCKMCNGTGLVSLSKYRDSFEFYKKNQNKQQELKNRASELTQYYSEADIKFI